jgi:hypothetical protein
MSNENAQQMSPPSQPAAIVPVNEDELFEALEKRNKLLERILSYAIAATHSSQWTNLGDRPWPTGPACEAMARRCGVSWDEVQSEKTNSEDERGKFYTWTYRARFHVGRDEITAEGHCSSRDQFLGTGTGLGEDATRPLYEVDEGNIRQASYTNMVVNGVTRLLGVRNLSWERLEKLLGVKREELAKADFKSGARGGGQGQPSDDVILKFGRGKDKKLSEVGDDDVRWYVGCWEKDLADPTKSKYHANSRRSIEIAQGILARRANEKAGTAAAPPGEAKPSLWQRIRALDKTIPEDVLKELTKKATGKASAFALVEEDVAKVAKAIEEAKKSTGEDVKF